MTAERGRYRTHCITFDMEGRSEGDYEDYRRDLDRLEANHPGALLLSNDETRSYPTCVVNETRLPPTRLTP